MKSAETLYALAYSKFSASDDDLLTTLGMEECERLCGANITIFDFALFCRGRDAFGEKRTRAEQLEHAAVVMKVTPPADAFDHLSGDLRRRARAVAAEAELLGRDVACCLVADTLPERYPHGARSGRKLDMPRMTVLSAAYYRFLVAGRRTTEAAELAAHWLGIPNGRDAVQKAERRLRRMLTHAYIAAGIEAAEAREKALWFSFKFISLLEQCAVDVENDRIAAIARRRADRFAKPISAQTDEPRSSS